VSKFVIFENAGEIDPLAIRTFGVSVKESDDPIGFFGTGLKYALAILLRNSHQIMVQAGQITLPFGTKQATIRNQPVNLITMDDEPLGFTDAVGKTWEVWMAYRELYCNCKDEHGTVYVADELPAPKAGTTRVIVSGDAFLQEHNNRSSFIIVGEPWLKLENCEIYEGESLGIFYRGILVHRLPKGEVSKFTYNITESVDLTEDRTAKYPFMFPPMISASALCSENEDFLRQILNVDRRYYEHGFDFRAPYGNPKPTKTFLDTVESLSQVRTGQVNVSAKVRYKTEKRAELMPATTKLVGVESEMLKKAVKFCRALGFPVSEYPIIITDTLGPNILGMAEGGRIYVSRRALMQGTKIVAGTLIEEFIHLRHSLQDETRDMQNFLIDRLVSLGERLDGKPL
jgi:hypothetical protein